MRYQGYTTDAGYTHPERSPLALACLEQGNTLTAGRDEGRFRYRWRCRHTAQEEVGTPRISIILSLVTYGLLVVRASTDLLPGQSTQAAIVLGIDTNIACIQLGGHNASCRADKRCIEVIANQVISHQDLGR